MAAYAGTTTVIFSISMGSRRVSLVQIAVTNYNSATGIPFLPQYVGLGVIEAVFGSVTGKMEDLNSPSDMCYDPTGPSLRLYVSGGTPVPSDVNIFNICGLVTCLVIGA